MSELVIPEDLLSWYKAIESFKHHGADVCDCDLEGGDETCAILPKRPTPYEWECLSGGPRIKELIERIARLEAALAATKWISVEERLPDVNDEVWVWTIFHDSDNEYGDASWLQDDGTWAMGSAKNFTVTHWQPLPAPPSPDSAPEEVR